MLQPCAQLVLLGAVVSQLHLQLLLAEHRTVVDLRRRVRLVRAAAGDLHGIGGIGGREQTVELGLQCAFASFQLSQRALHLGLAVGDDGHEIEANLGVGVFVDALLDHGLGEFEPVLVGTRTYPHTRTRHHVSGAQATTRT